MVRSNASPETKSIGGSTSKLRKSSALSHASNEFGSSKGGVGGVVVEGAANLEGAVVDVDAEEAVDGQLADENVVEDKEGPPDVADVIDSDSFFCFFG